MMSLNGTRTVTCRLLHNRTYISNPHFKITGISKYVAHPLLTVTALHSLQIDYFDSNGSLIGYYRASNSQLPLTMTQVDAQRLSSIITIEHDKQHTNEARVTLTHIPTSTQITVNSWSKFYFFLVRSSELLLMNSHGYLITGCPSSNIIDRQMIINRLEQRFVRSQRQVVVKIPTRQHRHNLMQESNLPQQYEQICSSDGNHFIDECLFDSLALATINTTQALTINKLHTSVSRVRRQLVDNDRHVVKLFQECYRQGLICQSMNNPDTIVNRGYAQQMAMLLLFFNLSCSTFLCFL
jgi:hypothetical protein